MARAYVGNGLRELCVSAAELERRDMFPDIERFLGCHPEGKLLALFGLRRTGKTIMMLQAAHKRLDDSAFVMAEEGDDMADISSLLWKLKGNGCRHFFVDEATKAADFAKHLDGLADSFGMMGCHVVMAGTDSFNFCLAETKALGRVLRIGMTRIPFAEHRRLIPGLSISDYARQGGILDRSSLLDQVTGRKDGSYMRRLACGYTLSAIAENIQHSLESFEGIWPGVLSELCRMQEMTSLINLCAHHDTHRLMIRTINRKFAFEEISHLVSAFNAMMAPERLDKRALAELHKRSLSILDMDERKIKLSQDILDEVESLLHDIGALAPATRMIADRTGAISFRRENVFRQSGIRWGQVESLIEIAAKMAPDLPPSLLTRTGRVTFGKILEDALFLEVAEEAQRHGLEVERFSLVDGKDSAEADIVISLPDKGGFYAFEVKADEDFSRTDSRHLRDRRLISILEEAHGPMLDWGVLRPNADISIPHELDAEKFVLDLPSLISEMTGRLKCPAARTELREKRNHRPNQGMGM